MLVKQYVFTTEEKNISTGPEQVRDSRDIPDDFFHFVLAFIYSVRKRSLLKT